MIQWLWNVGHLALIFALFMLYLVIKALDRVHDDIVSVHKDYRKVNSLDAREYLEMEAQMPGPSPSSNSAPKGQHPD